MKINYNPTKMKGWLFEDTIQTQASLFLESESNTYVVFDGTAKILCEGTLDECYVYQAEYKKAVGFSPAIYAKEAYENMMKKGKESYERTQKPKESWLQKAKREIENADYLLALRNLELRLIRKEKRKMEWKEITLDNEDYVYALEDNGIPVLFAQDYGDDGIGYFDDRWVTVHTMAKSGGFYFYEVPRLEIKKV